jgi:hypothetical protein
MFFETAKYCYWPIIFGDVNELNENINMKISKEEILKCIKKLKNNKACWEDLVINEYIKSTTNTFIDIYEQLFNIIFETGIVPDNWLMGNIKPIYKNKGDKMAKHFVLLVFENFKKVKKYKQVIKRRVINSRIIFETGIVPDNWLMGNIKPIYKNKGDKMDPKNYRPITILSCLGKLFTAVLSERLTKYSDDFFLF